MSNCFAISVFSLSILEYVKLFRYFSFHSVDHGICQIVSLFQSSLSILEYVELFRYFSLLSVDPDLQSSFIPQKVEIVKAHDSIAALAFLVSAGPVVVNHRCFPTHL